jgi:hypothetical protein
LENIKLGYEKGTGEEVSIPYTHSFINGITRHGKTESLKALLSRMGEEYKALIFDVKTPPDYEGIGSEIPIYLEESTDPSTVKGLLESFSGEDVKYQFSELIQVCEEGDNYKDILNRVNEWMDKEDVHPVEEKKLQVLRYLLKRLVSNLEDVVISDDLVLDNRINVMPLHTVDRIVHQLAVSSSVRWVLEKEKNTIMVLDEASRFIPQKKRGGGSNPPAKSEITRTIREGAARNNWMWLSDQTITGTDKEPLKQVHVWILGKQREKNEADRVKDQIPVKTSISRNDIMTLPKGHFITGSEEGAPITYVQPSWLSEDKAEKVALGEIPIENLEEFEPEVSKTNKVERLEQELQETNKELQDLRNKLDKKNEIIAEKNETIDKLEKYAEGEEEEETTLMGGPRALPSEKELNRKIEFLIEDKLEESIDSLLVDKIENLDVPENIDVMESIPKITVRRKIKPLELTESDLEGKISIVYANGELPEDKWFTTGDLYNIFQSHGWSKDPRGSKKLDKFCHWGYFKKHYAGNRPEYKLVLTPEEAKERGLLEYKEIKE